MYVKRISTFGNSIGKITFDGNKAFILEKRPTWTRTIAITSIHTNGHGDKLKVGLLFQHLYIQIPCSLHSRIFAEMEMMWPKKNESVSQR